MSIQATKRPRTVHDISCGRALRERALGQADSPDPVPAVLVARIAATIAEHCGHRLLKCLRLAMGWTVAQAVRAAHDLVEAEHLGKVGLSERSWKDWEAGVLPSPDYQDLLCRLFTTNPVGLGFAHDYSPPPSRTKTARFGIRGSPMEHFLKEKRPAPARGRRPSRRWRRRSVATR